MCLVLMRHFKQRNNHFRGVYKYEYETKIYDVIFRIFYHGLSTALSLLVLHIYLKLYHHTMSRSKIPVSNSVTALEIWLLTCVMLVFLSLAEYSLILWDGVKRRNASHRRLEVGEIILGRVITSRLRPVWTHVEAGGGARCPPTPAPARACITTIRSP